MANHISDCQNKRLNSQMEMSPDIGGQYTHSKAARVLSPSPTTPVHLPDETPAWAKALHASLCERMTTFERNINAAVDFAADTATEAFAATGINKVEINKINERCEYLEDKLHRAEQYNKKLEQKVIDLESYSRRDNLLFYGLDEEKGENAHACENKIRKIISDLGIEDVGDMKLVRCHRKGLFLKNKTRPIIVKFHWAGDIKKIMQAKKSKLPRESKIFISEDWPAEVDDRRKVLKPIFRRALNTDHSARLIADKLYVDHKLYTIDTIESLPEDLNPTFTSTQYKGEYVAFWGQFSHFSTFHKQTFEIKNNQYCTVEQAYQHQKALFFKDIPAAAHILSESDPVKCKYLGRNITEFESEKWNDKSTNIMKQILFAKFSGNSTLKQRLLDTGDKTLCQASVKDTYWGIGLDMKQETICDQSAWKGQNQLGQALMKVRDELKDV